MRTALLLTSSESTRQLVNSALGRHTNLILVPPGDLSTSSDFDRLFYDWLSLADALIIDCVALQELSKPALESLVSLPLSERHSVTVLLTSLQRSIYAPLLGDDWLLIDEKSFPDQLKQLLGNFLDLRQIRLRSRRLDTASRRQGEPLIGSTTPFEVSAPLPGSPESYRYREALKQVSRLLAQPNNEKDLIRDFLALLRELLGLSRSALLVRNPHFDLGGRISSPLDDYFVVAASTGLAPRVTEHLRLSLESGIPRFLASEARILCRNRATTLLSDDSRLDIEREFEMLKTDVALPLFSNDDLTGIFTCGGKITGEPLTNQELELTYHLVSQLGTAILGIRLNNRIARQERFMSRVLAEIQTGVLVLDSDCRILVLNDRARDLLGLATQDHVDLSNRLPARVSDVVFETVKTGAEISRREVLLPRTGRLLSVSATRLEANGNSEQGAAVALIEDLTPIRSQEAQTQKLREQELFMRLAYRLSHELRNSLVSVKTFIQLLPQYTNEDRSQGNFATLVLDEVNRIDSVVQNLSFFAKSPETVFDDVPVTALISDAIAEAARRSVFRKLAHIVEPGQPAADSTDLPLVTIKTNLNHKVEVIRGDRTRLTEAFQELLLNAVQSMPPGGGRILLTTESAGDTLTVEIKDTGQGIALENLGKVTEPFFTTRNVGVGLGLTVVAKILDWHSGRLTIDSKLGQGSTVTVQLQVRPPSSGLDLQDSPA